MFLSKYKDKKTIFYLLYKITKVFPSFRDVIHVFELQYKKKMTSAYLCTLKKDEALPIRAFVRCVSFYNKVLITSRQSMLEVINNSEYFHCTDKKQYFCLTFGLRSFGLF